jgi:hypothetical protein
MKCLLKRVFMEKSSGLWFGGTGFFHPDPDRLSLDRNPSRSESRQNILSRFLMPLPLSVNTIHPDFKPIKIFTRDSVAPIAFLTGISVLIPFCREKSRNFDPAPDGTGIGRVPPDPTRDQVIIDYTVTYST